MKKMLMLGAVSVLSIAMGTAVFASNSFGGETKEAAAGNASRPVCTTMAVNAKDSSYTYTDENHDDYCRYHTDADHDNVCDNCNNAYVHESSHNSSNRNGHGGYKSNHLENHIHENHHE